VCPAQLSGDGIILCDLPEPHGTIGDIYAGNLSTASEDRLFGKS
jgi:hypothetical protein